ncbi:MAG TPA: hypothetical protein VLN72_04330, partial [Gillisia sp.]|nr:hypothetical protein [Gillisia sp.]
TTGIVTLLKERAVFVDDFWELGSYFFQAPEKFEEKAAQKIWKEETSEIMENLIKIISQTDPYAKESIQDNVKSWITTSELGFGKVMQPFRLSLVGAMQGPDVFEIAAIIGKNETLRRLKYAIATL